MSPEPIQKARPIAGESDPQQTVTCERSKAIHQEYIDKLWKTRSGILDYLSKLSFDGLLKKYALQESHDCTPPSFTSDDLAEGKIPITRGENLDYDEDKDQKLSIEEIKGHLQNSTGNHARIMAAMITDAACPKDALSTDGICTAPTPKITDEKLAQVLLQMDDSSLSKLLPNFWEQRQSLVVELIRQNPERVAGLQEIKSFKDLAAITAKVREEDPVAASKFEAAVR